MVSMASSEREREHAGNGAQLRMGVYFAAADIASFGSRLAAFAIDAIVSGGGLVLAAGALSLASLPVEMIALVVLGLAWGYFAVLKATPEGTPGYRLLGVRLVDLDGDTPALWRTSYRFLWLVLFPGIAFADLLLLSADLRGQTFRDKLAGTYVVSRRAVPAGSGPIVFPQFFILGMCFGCAEVATPR
jgi:uncharacterized RDD family membrane protein YckC